MGELYLANLPGMGQSRVLMRGYEHKRPKECLNLAKKSLWIIMEILTDHCRVNYYLGKLEISMLLSVDSVRRVRKPVLTFWDCVWYLVSRLRHLGEYLIPDSRLKHLEVGNTTQFLSVTRRAVVYRYNISSKRAQLFF